MKYRFLPFFSIACVFLVLFAIPVAAEGPDIDWQNCLGGTGNDEGYSISPTSDGGYIATGLTLTNNDGDVSGNHGSSDLWVVKLDSVGNLTWQKCLGGTGAEYGNSIFETSDGGYIATGYTISINGNVSGKHDESDLWVVKLDSVGNLTWQKCLGGSDYDYGNSLSETSDGGFIATGHTKSNDYDVSGNHGGIDMWVVKLDSGGNLTWQNCLGGTGTDDGYSISETSDGGFIATGQTNSDDDGDVFGNHGGWDMWVVKLNSAGTLSWQKCLGGTGADYGYSISGTSDGGYIATGYTYSTDGDVSGNHGGFDLWVVKLDSVGNLTWQKCLGGTDSDYGESIFETSDGGYIATGNTGSINGNVSGNHGGTDLWVVNLDSVGNLTWQKCLGGSWSDLGFSISGTPDGGYIVTGYTESNDYDVSGNHGSIGSRDLWVVKLNPEALAANFTAATTSGTAPLAVQFEDTSTGTISSWNWTFGDGNTSAEQNPAYTYTDAGTYTVSLTVSNAGGSDTLTKTDYITIMASSDIPLSAGWNLISIPVTNTNLTVPAEVTGSVYVYDPIGGTYATTTTSALEPGKGYWVSATADCTLIVTGYPVESYTGNLSQGWNMIGSVYENTSFSAPQTVPAGAVQNSVYAYDLVSGMYVSTTTLTPGSGYWASATADCILTVSTT